MKANETSERYAGKVRECCNYAARSAKNFAAGDNNKKRQPCGPDEKVLATTLKADLTGFGDTITEETFSADQKAYILSNLLMFVFMLISAACAVCGCIGALVQYGMVFDIIAVLFSALSLLSFFGAFGGTSKNVTGTNIIATRDPSGDLKKRFIVEANLDAPFKRKISRKAEKNIKFFTFLGILLYLTFDIVSILVLNDVIAFFADEVFMYIAIPLAIFAFLPLILSRSVIATASFPGVIDNLIGCYTACGAMRYLSEMDLRLKNTEFCIVLDGAKNAGHSGLKTYCKTHNAANAEVETFALCLDSIYNPETLTALTGNKKATDLIGKATANAEVKLLSTVPKKIKKKGSGKIFKKNKYSYATLTTMEEVVPPFFGPSDTEEHINVPAIESVMKTVLEAAYAFDEK